ncbi:phosphonate metabolism protein/1,5-bisphosphokinase (PRPP-forming) PhnN [Mesorhizobium sp. 1M-11]|uniref:phosphonate metabolism protein/1,5-bisphosphokinase (PRPP-forming) PhnN n=1 Tax=Mesorhizobium sp. 1M-11 TaxID=1529006 RepID=UPI0006C75866|nr:phosphonate metabolism protein/1,5-bisphosphokinase (PRPP-forming) PhnN [Mesorhizobium sp. 1M-11]
MPDTRLHGTLVVVVGPSGAGKDSVIGYARERLATRSDILFVRRIVTREATADAEDHDSLSEVAFAEAQGEGRFAVSWQANGLSYALPRSVMDHVSRGDTAIANGSRGAIEDIRAAFANVIVVGLTARPEIIAARLSARGRETAEEIGRRVERGLKLGAYGQDITIDNSAELQTAGEALISIITGQLSLAS